MASLIQLFALCVFVGVAAAAPQCQAVGDLGDRFQKNLDVNDADKDGKIVGNEIYNDFKTNYDKDNDGCVTLQEWTDRWVQGFKLTAEYAKARFTRLAALLKNDTATATAACPVPYPFYQNNPNKTFTVSRFLEGNLRTLVQLCQAQPELLATNCDCAQLAGECQGDALLSPTAVCTAFNADPLCSALPSISARFQLNLDVNDADKDGVVVGNEIYNDFKNNYDTDKDGCVTVDEWVSRWNTFFYFSDEFAKARLQELVPDLSVQCAVQYAFYQNNANIKMPLAGFLDSNVDSLLKMCNADSSLFQTNCDCKQIAAACVSDTALLAPTAPCKNFVNNKPVVGRR